MKRFHWSLSTILHFTRLQFAPTLSSPPPPPQLTLCLFERLENWANIVLVCDGERKGRCFSATLENKFLNVLRNGCVAAAAPTQSQMFAKKAKSYFFQRCRTGLWSYGSRETKLLLLLNLRNFAERRDDYKYYYFIYNSFIYHKLVFFFLGCDEKYFFALYYHLSFTWV